MRKFFTLLTALLITSSLLSQESKKIVILHTNDMHSCLTGFGPEADYTPLTVNDDKTYGGFARIATLIRHEKEQHPGVTLVVDGGDFLMGTLFHSLEVKTGFQLSLMKKMGYDLTCFGNHEFDFGPEKIASIVRASVSQGQIPGILLSNAVFDEKDPGDDKLQSLFNENIISRKQIIPVNGLRVGVFSLMGKDAADVAPKAAPLKFDKQVPFAKRMVAELKKENCDLIICISHSGVVKGEKPEWDGEDVELAEKVKGINLIISGHTHSKMDKPFVVNGVPIVQAGDNGRFVGRLELSWSVGQLKIDDYRLIPVDDNIPGNPIINSLIQEQKTLINSMILAPLGYNYDSPVAETDFRLECNVTGDLSASNLGPLVADAIHNYVNHHSSDGADVGMVSAGVIRERILPGIVKTPDIFRVMSLGSGNDDVPGYPFSRLYVTGKELKSILEILLVAYKSSSDYYCYYSGIRVEYDPGKRLLKKISRIEIEKPDGIKASVDFSKKNTTLYSITANSYMLEFIGIIKKMSYGLINVVPKDKDGNKVTDMKTAVIDINEKKDGLQEGKEWLALQEYLQQMKDMNGNGLPDLDKKYSEPVKCFNVVK